MKRKSTYFRIRELRLNKGIQQQELAERLNYSKQSVNNWESGKNMPPSATLPEIARVLGCTVNDLYRPEVL